MTVGEKVKLIFTEEVGIVTAYVDGETLMVEIEGVEIPIFREHLERYEDVELSEKKPPETPSNLPNKQVQQTQKKASEKTHPAPNTKTYKTRPDEGEDRGLQVVLQPFYDAEGLIEYFLVHLVNQSSGVLAFNYYVSVFNEDVFEFSKEVMPHNSLIINSIPYDQLNDKPILEFQFTLLNHIKEYELNFTREVKPKAKMLRNPPQYIPFIQADGYVLVLCNQLPKFKRNEEADLVHLERDALQQLKINMYNQKMQQNLGDERVKVNSKLRVIDLHIEQLLTSYKHLTKTAMLQVQLKHLEENLTEAIKRKEPNMIVIHGVGKGKLKQEVFKTLMSYPEVRTFKNDYDHRFGFGATEVIFEYEEG